jgi:hypothetical protein
VARVHLLTALLLRILRRATLVDVYTASDESRELPVVVDEKAHRERKSSNSL